MQKQQRKLLFLVSLMESKGVGKHELARMMGVSPPGNIELS